ncbi:MAG: hypothetical protein LBT62_05940 [Deltaproteobacteria bacterium]|jgi:hypothetical protein|nr:hypothetical protein [Deltaproteobacteria bacterium]
MSPLGVCTFRVVMSPVNVVAESRVRLCPMARFGLPEGVSRPDCGAGHVGIAVNAQEDGTGDLRQRLVR